MVKTNFKENLEFLKEIKEYRLLFTRSKIDNLDLILGYSDYISCHLDIYENTTNYKYRRMTRKVISKIDQRDLVKILNMYRLIKYKIMGI